MSKQRFFIAGVPIDPLTQSEVLEKIKLYLSHSRAFTHIVSINPENVVIAQHNSDYLRVCVESDLALTDGIGVVFAARLLGKRIPERVSGSVLLPHLLDLVGTMGLTGVLIGSQADLALQLAQCYSRSYPEATFIGTKGYVDCTHPTQEEEEAIAAIVRDRRPHFVFVAFGSPFQELWIKSHKELLQGAICMGIGGGFDYLSGAIQSPPRLIRKMGLEWLYRLITQPWRAKRQFLRLPRFIGIILKEWFWGIIHPRHEQVSQKRS